MFGHFEKAIVRQKGYKMAEWERSSNQPTRWLIPMLRKLARVNDVNTVIYSLDPTRNRNSFHSDEYGKK